MSVLIFKPLILDQSDKLQAAFCKSELLGSELTETTVTSSTYLMAASENFKSLIMVLMLRKLVAEICGLEVITNAFVKFY